MHNVCIKIIYIFLLPKNEEKYILHLLKLNYPMDQRKQKINLLYLIHESFLSEMQQLHYQIGLFHSAKSHKLCS